MREYRQAILRPLLLFAGLASAIITKKPSSMKYALISAMVLWVYDILTVRRKFEKKWGTDHSIRV